MGLFSVALARQRDSRTPKLPLYEKVDSPTKERYSSDSYDESDEDDEDDHSDASAPRSSGSRDSSSHGSRHSSGSIPSSATSMLPRPKKFRALPRRPGRAMGYRLPNRVVRWLCIGLVTTIALFMYTLVRASQNENKMIAEGKAEKPPPRPPAWEEYPFLTRYYGGVRNLVSLEQSVPEYPRSAEEPPVDKLSYVNGTEAATKELPSSKPFVHHPQSIFKTAQEDIKECYLDEGENIRVPPIRYYDGRPNGFPEAPMGSYELLGIAENICYDRYGRFGPYGFGYSVRTGGLGTGEHGDNEGADSTWGEASRVDYRKVDWAAAQRRCYQSNVERYEAIPKRPSPPHGFFIDDNAVQKTKFSRAAKFDNNTSTHGQSVAEKLPRTAIVLRCWDEHLLKEEDVMNIRSLITETSLASGGRYDVHLLVEVKNDGKYPIWADAETYEKRIRDAIPAEFRGITTLWSVTQMLAIYQGIHDLYVRGPDLPVHGSYRGLQMAMQHFATQHPEYEHFWQWEMDVRYTGHYYDLFSKLESWAKEQPRKGLWERNDRFYLPSVHGTWEDFKQMSRVQSSMGTTGADNVWDGMPGTNKEGEGKARRADKTIWGPERPLEESDWFETESDPKPPTSYEKDKYDWGVGEEADYITLNPLFNPASTTWELRDDITGYNVSRAPPPRRAHIITASRMSRRLLTTMHRETAHKKHFAFSEMWPATVALHHGYKAVYVPHPVYVDREWPLDLFATTLNNGKNGATGGSRTAVYGQREHNLMGLTWFYNSGFGPNLYRRWLGLKVNNDGGEEFEMVEDKTKSGETVGEMRGGEGRMCLPPMLLHPVKGVELPVEESREEKEIPVSDPAA